MRNSSPPCERGEGRKAAGGFRAAGDSGPYGRGSSHSVGAAISRPPSQSRLRRASSPKGGAKRVDKPFSVIPRSEATWESVPPSKAFPTLGGRWHGKAVTDEGDHGGAESLSHGCAVPAPFDKGA